MIDARKVVLLVAVFLVIAAGAVLGVVRRELMKPKTPQVVERVGPEAQLAVFHLPRAKVDVATVAGKPSNVKVRTMSTREYVVPAPEKLEHARGLDEAGQEEVSNSTEVTVIDVELGADPAAAMMKAEKYAFEVAQAAGGALWDEEAQELSSAEVWKKRRLDSWKDGQPYVAYHIIVYVDDMADGTLELSTAGLRHFGVPELIATGVGRGSERELGDLVNLTAQVMAERPTAVRAGSTLTLDLEQLKHPLVREWQLELCHESGQKKLTVRLDATDKPGLLRLELDGKGTPAERFEAAFSTLYGFNDEVVHEEHDEELLKVSKAALVVLRKKVKPRFDRGLKYGEVLLVKAPFETSSGGNEWMWVEVQKWKKNGQISGLLDNTPEDVPDLQPGALVTVKEAELFDWVLHEADGGWSGNTTGDVLRKRQGKGPLYGEE